MITAAADGSALNNPGPAGWAWYVDDSCWAAGGWPSGTNNRGELQAVLDLLEQTAATDEELHVLCDSQYVINVITRWMAGWKRKGWKKADGKPVLNQDLVKALDEAMTGRRVTFEWVKGHAGHELNEAADQRARAAATAYRDGTTVDAGPGFTLGGASVAGIPAAQDEELLTEPEPEPELGVPRAGFAGDLFSDLDEDQIPEISDTEKVIAAEQSLLTPTVREDPARVAALLHPEWSEVGTSGRVRSRAEMLAEIGPLDSGVADEFQALGVEQVSADAILLRWQLPGSRRSSLWVRHGDEWLQRFHQGTSWEDA